MKNFKQPGDVITLTAPAGGVVSGIGYQIGRFFVVAQSTVAATLKFAGALVGVFELTKNAPEVWAEGDPLYWDSATSEVTIVAAGNKLIGVAADAALSADILGDVWLSSGGATHFKSAEQTGDGSSQDIAHGLGVVPSLVMIYPTDTAPATAGAYTQVEGVHDATNVKTTVTTGKKYKVVAFA